MYDISKKCRTEGLHGSRVKLWCLSSICIRSLDITSSLLLFWFVRWSTSIELSVSGIIRKFWELLVTLNDGGWKRHLFLRPSVAALFSGWRAAIKEVLVKFYINAFCTCVTTNWQSPYRPAFPKNLIKKLLYCKTARVTSSLWEFEVEGAPQRVWCSVN